MIASWNLSSWDCFSLKCHCLLCQIPQNVVTALLKYLKIYEIYLRPHNICAQNNGLSLCHTDTHTQTQTHTHTDTHTHTHTTMEPFSVSAAAEHLFCWVKFQHFHLVAWISASLPRFLFYSSCWLTINL